MLVKVGKFFYLFHEWLHRTLRWWSTTQRYFPLVDKSAYYAQSILSVAVNCKVNYGVRKLADQSKKWQKYILNQCDQ